jgi:hypothetical protein
MRVPSFDVTVSIRLLLFLKAFGWAIEVDGDQRLGW